jgi:hypothetical protein
MGAGPSELEFGKMARELKGLQTRGYAVVGTAGGEDALVSAACTIGRFIGTHSFGMIHLRATGSEVWLGRHTETLTDGPVPIRYFALGCLVPAAQGGETHLFDGHHAARLLLGSLPSGHRVRIRYRSQYRAEAADHLLIVDDEQHGPVLRFRSASEHNVIVAKPVGISEDDLYATVEEAVSASLVHIHAWGAGDLLVVDNHRMVHSRAPFVGLRHMLRFRYDDPLHRAVILAR